jgi:transcription antitermination protein NusB
VGRESDVRVIARRRRAARKSLAQALYQLQVGGQPWQDVHQQFVADPEFADADADYFREALAYIAEQRAALDERIVSFSDVDLARLDPVEHGILWLGLYELTVRPDVPYRVVINEGVELTKRFGATDGHKYVNAILDRAAAALREAEHGAP